MGKKINLTSYDNCFEASIKENEKILKEIFEKYGCKINAIGHGIMENTVGRYEIDFLIELDDILVDNQFKKVLEELEYKYMGNDGIENRNVFLKTTGYPKVRIHFMPLNAAEAEYFKMVNYYLVNNKEAQKTYNKFKKHINIQYPYNNIAYQESKNQYFLGLKTQIEKNLFSIL